MRVRRTSGTTPSGPVVGRVPFVVPSSRPSGAPGPAGGLPVLAHSHPTISSVMSSTDRPVVSTTWAPSATPRGDTARVRSRWSRRERSTALLRAVVGPVRRRWRSGTPSRRQWEGRRNRCPDLRPPPRLLARPPSAAVVAPWPGGRGGWRPPPTRSGSRPILGWPRSRRRRRPSPLRPPSDGPPRPTRPRPRGRTGQSLGREQPRSRPGTWPRCPAGRGPDAHRAPATASTCRTRLGRRWR